MNPKDFGTLDDIPQNFFSCQFSFTDNSQPLSSSSPSTCGVVSKDKFKQPKRNKSAFILFSSETRKIIKAQTGGQVNSNEMMVKLADLWRELGPKQKEKYYQQADKDKERYLEELSVYLQNCPSGVIKNKTKKNHIKKPCSSYAIFVKEMKEVIQGERPGLKMADILKVIAERWKKLTDDEKAVYQEKSRIEKEVVKAKLDENFARDQIKAEHLMEEDLEAKENFPHHQNIKKTSKRPNDFMFNDFAYKCLKTEEIPIKDCKDVTLSTTRSVSNSEPLLKVEDMPTGGSFALLEFPDLDFQNCDINRPSLDPPSFFKDAFDAENDGKSLMDLKESKKKKTSEYLFDLLSYDLGRQRSASFNNNNNPNDTERQLRRDFLNKAIITALKRTENDIFKQEQFSDPTFIDLQL